MPPLESRAACVRGVGVCLLACAHGLRMYVFLATLVIFVGITFK